MKISIKKKKLVIISGATGSIGSCFFEQLILDLNFHVVGLSRHGLKTEKIPNYNCIVSFDFENKKSYKLLEDLVKENNYEKIIYIHGVGKFITEINSNRQTFSEPKPEEINKEVVKLTFDYTSKVVNTLLKSVKRKTKVSAVNIGSLSDEFEIPVFQSWRFAQTKLIKYFEKITKSYKNFSALTVRVSTILGAKELIDRPHLFDTQTDPNFWLPKTELVEYVKRRVGYCKNESKIEKLYRSYPKFEKNHWDISETFTRRVKEIYHK